jgi:hypothetical protein
MLVLMRWAISYFSRSRGERVLVGTSTAFSDRTARENQPNDVRRKAAP